MSRPIPEIRDELFALAGEIRKEGFDHWADRLNELAEHTKRRPIVGRSSTKSRELTPALAAQIRAYIHNNPDRSQQEVANRFKVNPGRVSEAIHHDI